MPKVLIINFYICSRMPTTRQRHLTKRDMRWHACGKILLTSMTRKVGNFWTTSAIWNVSSSINKESMNSEKPFCDMKIRFSRMS